MIGKELLNELKDQDVRVGVFKESFPLFFLWHFGWELADFHIEMLEDLGSGKSVLWEMFRASRKTSMARAHAAWTILYSHDPYIVVQSYEDTLSAEWVRGVAQMLCEESIIADYGNTFPFDVKKEDLTKHSVSNFTSTTGVKIESKSLNQVLRGSNAFVDGKSVRPTLLYLDDIDVEKSVKNVRIVDENERKILGETIGALDPLRRRIIFLGNTILTDGIVPRFRERYSEDPNWIVRRQPLFDEKGENVWPEVFTDDVVSTLRSDGMTAFAQNYMLVPYVNGDAVVRRDQIKWVESVGKVTDVRIGVDPAISEKTLSDEFAITVTLTSDGIQHVCECVALREKEKEIVNALGVIKDAYEDYKRQYPDASICVNVETVAYQKVLATALKERHVNVRSITPTKDKVMRLMERQ
jgi:hypothetical protein